jgi:hypothetical protein
MSYTHAIRLQPALFFHEILKRDLSLLSLIDSTSTVLTRVSKPHEARILERMVNKSIRRRRIVARGPS